MVPLWLLLNILAAFANASIIWLFIALFYAYKKITVADAQSKP
jgi:hypothetical protein